MQFDDYTAITGAAFLPLTPTSAGGPYQGLYFNSMDGGKRALSSTGLSTGVQPNTPQNFAVYGPSIGNNAGVPALTTVYASSMVSTFTLQGFWYGCNFVTGNQLVNAPASCDIVIAGLDAGGKLLKGASQTFQFRVSQGQLTAQMVEASVKSAFGKASTVHFQVLGVAGASNSSLVANLDTISYVLFGKS